MNYPTTHPINKVKFLLISFFFLSSWPAFNQNDSAFELQIDSLNRIIDSPSSHDTLVAASYVALSEVLYFSNFDTLLPLCIKAKEVAEDGLIKNDNGTVQHSLRRSLALALNNIAYAQQIYGQNKLAFKHYHRAIRIQTEIDDKYGLAMTLNNLALLHQQLGEIDLALDYFHQSYGVQLKIDDTFGQAYCLNNIGAIYHDQGKLSLCLDYYHKSLEIQEKSGDKRGQAVSLNNIGMVYMNQDNDKIALDYFNRALVSYREIGDVTGESKLIQNIGSIYEEFGDPDCEVDDCQKLGLKKALENYQQSLFLLRTTNQQSSEGFILQFIGEFYYDNGIPDCNIEEDCRLPALDSAQTYLRAAYQIFKKINNLKGIARSANLLSKCLLERGDYAESEKFALEGYQIASELGFPYYIFPVALSMSEIYEHKGDYKRSLLMYKVYHEMNDSVYNYETQQNNLIHQAEYEYNKEKAVNKAAHQKELESQKEIAEKEQQKQNIVLSIVSIGLLLVLIFSLALYNRFKITNRQKAIIVNQKETVEEQNKEILASITYAKRIQNAILPPTAEFKEAYKDSFILYEPKDIVAGDFYWQERVGGKLLWAVADCTGHGVPGAMVSVVCNNGLNRSAREHHITDPGVLLDKTREIVITEFQKSEEEVKDGMDIALCALEKDVLKFSGAHNPLWVIRKGEHTVESFGLKADKTVSVFQENGYTLIELKGDKQPVGDHPAMTRFTTRSVKVSSEDSIYVFSDGYVDQFGGEKGKKFKAINLKRLLLAVQGLPMNDQKLKLKETLYQWMGNIEQVDDICLIGVKVHFS